MNEEIYTRGLRRGPEVPLTKRRFVFDFWLPFLSQTNKFYILMEFDSNGGLGKRKNRSPESRVKEGGWCRVALEKEAWLLRPDFSLPRFFTLPLPSRRLLIRSFFTNWTPGLEIIVVKIYLLKLWCGKSGRFLNEQSRNKWYRTVRGRTRKDA